MHPRRLLVLLVFASLAWVSPARATRVVVVAPKMIPPGAAELRDKFHDALAKGLVRAGEVIPGAEVRSRLAATPELLQCGGGACVARVAMLMHADRVVIADIEDSGKNYSIRLKVFDASGAEVGSGPEERCEICTVREAGRAVERAAERTVATVQAAAARPNAGKLPTDEEEVPGEQPRVAPRREQPTTTPVVERRPVERPQPVERKPVETPSTVATPAVTPVETTPATVGEESRPSRGPYRSLAIGAFVVAGAALATTIGFAAFAGKDGKYLNDDGTDCKLADPVHQCKKLYSGNTAGAVGFGVVTAVFAGAGALLLYLDSRHRVPRSTTVGVGPIPGGAAAAASFEF